MKNKEIEVLQKVLSVIETKLPQETKLIYEFRTTFEAMLERNSNRNQSYINKANYYRSAVSEWRRKNPEKVKEYHKRYQEKKRIEQKEKVLHLSNQGKTISEITKELKMSEKAVMFCLEERQNQIQ